MGRTVKEIVKANIQEIVSDLTKAYADEWLAHYQYWLTLNGLEVWLQTH